MTNTSFLDKIAQVLLVEYSGKLSNTIVVLPNKRAKIFLIEALKNKVDQNIISPEIVRIEELIQDIASIRAIDSIELLFEFYQVYLSFTEKSNQQSFELFANWAKTLLQDFNEIDRYLLEPEKVLKYLENIKEIDYGFDFYAPQTMIDSQGRRIMVAWMQSWNRIPLTTGLGWAGAMTFPRELTLDENNQLIQYPIAEIENYRKNNFTYQNQVDSLTKLEKYSNIADIEIDFIVSLSLNIAALIK